MISPQEFADAWGKQRLLLTLELLQDVDIPKGSKDFLVVAGLPLRAEVQEDLYVVPLQLFSTPQAIKLFLLARYEATPLRLLASVVDDMQWLGADYCENPVYYAVEEGTGIIYRIGRGVEAESVRFVNTSIAHFAEFLLCYREFLAHSRRDQSQYNSQLTLLKQRWRQIDPIALMDLDNYWVMCLFYQF